MSRGFRALWVAALLSASTGYGQEPNLPGADSVPFEVRFATAAVEAILGSGDRVTLEAYAADTVTGVYLYGSLRGEEETIGYGLNAAERRYLWFSIDHGPHVEYVAILFDIDADLAPDFLLFRTIDRKKNIEYATEYRSPGAVSETFDISFQSACQPPGCDPASWSIRPRTTLPVAESWFDPWRPLFALAAARGEEWIGRSRADLAPGAERDR